jgi:hypothetical protein
VRWRQNFQDVQTSSGQYRREELDHRKHLFLRLILKRREIFGHIPREMNIILMKA